MHKTRLRLPLGSALLLALAASATALGADAVQPARAPEVTIPFAAHDGIEDWQADGSRGLWIRARGRHWYYAKFFAPCSGLQFHEGLRFKFSPSGELDRWSEVYTRDTGHCAFTSLVASDGPPRKAKAAKPAPVAPTAPAAPATPTAPAPHG